MSSHHQNQWKSLDGKQSIELLIFQEWKKKQNERCIDMIESVKHDAIDMCLFWLKSFTHPLVISSYVYSRIDFEISSSKLDLINEEFVSSMSNLWQHSLISLWSRIHATCHGLTLRRFLIKTLHLFASLAPLKKREIKRNNYH